MPLRGDVHDVRVRRIDDDATDGARILEPHVRPGLAAVGALVDAVAPARALARVRLAGAHPHREGRRGRDGHGADGHHRVHVVEDGRPRRAVVGALPEPAAGGGDVDRVGLALHPCDGDVVDAAAGVHGADGPPRDGGERRLGGGPVPDRLRSSPARTQGEGGDARRMVRHDGLPRWWLTEPEHRPARTLEREDRQRRGRAPLRKR